MARLSYVEADHASPEVREIYEKMLGGKPGSVHKLLAHRPELFKNFGAFYGSVGRSLPRRLYEMVYIRVSALNGCHYWMQHHIASSKRVGLSAQDWDALNSGDYAAFSPSEQAALKFADKLTRNLRDISDADIDALQQHFSEEQVLDLDVLVGLINLTNRLTDPLGADLEFPEEKVGTVTGAK